MSHKSIIELGKTKLKPDEYICEDLFYEGFSGWIAEYVDGNVSESYRKNAIEEFSNEIMREFPDFVTADGESITFTFGFPEAYRKKRLAQVREAAETENDLGSLYWRMLELLGDPYGTYIYIDGCGTAKEECFLRIIAPGTYYFGGVIDYKY